MYHFVTHHALEPGTPYHHLLLDCWLSSCICLYPPAEGEKWELVWEQRKMIVFFFCYHVQHLVGECCQGFITKCKNIKWNYVVWWGFHHCCLRWLTCAEATRSTSPPRRRRRLSICGSGRPSFSQVREGAGMPVASHWSSRTLLTTTDTSDVTPDPSMCGGSKNDSVNQVKFIFPVSLNQKLKESQNYNLSLTKNFQVEVTASLTSSVASYAGVASCVINLGLANL